MLLVASAISLIGDAMAMVALPWFVLQTTGSAALTGLAGCGHGAAGLSGRDLWRRAGGPAGLPAQQHPRRSGERAGDRRHPAAAPDGRLELRGPVVLDLSWLAAGGAASDGLPLDAAGAGGCWPACGASGRTRAFESLQHLSFLLGPPLAGVLIAFLDAPGVLLIDASTFAVSALLVALAVPSLRAAQAPAAWRYREELLAGLRFLRRDHLLMAIAVSLALTNFFGNALFTVVLPVYTTLVAGRATDLGLMVAAEGAGALIGIALYGAFGHRLPRRLVWIVGYLAFAVMLWVLTLTPPIPVVVAALLVSGIVSGPINPLSVTVRQERIPIELRGRVFSTFSAIAMVSAPFGIALAGLLTEQRGLPWTLLVWAGCYTIVCVGMWFVPALREMDARPGVAPS